MCHFCVLILPTIFHAHILGNRHSLVGALGWQARDGPSWNSRSSPQTCQRAIWGFCLLNKFGPLVAKKSKCITVNLLLWPGTNTARLNSTLTNCNAQKAVLGAHLLNRLEPLVAKNPNGKLGTLWYGQGPILPIFIPLWPFKTLKTAIFGFCS